MCYIFIILNILIYFIFFFGNLQNKTKNLGFRSLNIISSSSEKTVFNSSVECTIPKLDPYHSDVLPYFSKTTTKSRCRIKNIANIVNGNLVLSVKNVQRAGFYYIRRVDDFNIKFSEWNSVTNDSIKQGACFIMFAILVVSRSFAGKVFFN